jgi:hypothetical protein
MCAFSNLRDKFPALILSIMVALEQTKLTVRKTNGKSKDYSSQGEEKE